MKRRHFLSRMGALSAAAIITPLSANAAPVRGLRGRRASELNADIVIIGGGLGGCAAALAALRNGARVILTEETDWIGGQLTSQGVPPDEHQWIETHGCTASYRALRNGIREYYRAHYALTPSARANPHLNPGDGAVSRLCHEPRVALAVIHAMLAPYLSNGYLTLLLEYRPIAAEVEGSQVRAIELQNLLTGNNLVARGAYFVDATELGDLLPLTKTEFVVGNEGKAQTGELHAPEKRDQNNHQAFTMCFAVDYIAGEEHVIDKPRDYDFWKNYIPKLNPAWPGKLLSLTYTHPATSQPRTLGFNPGGDTPGAFNLWKYRRLINPANFVARAYQGDISLINWPQNDYLLGNLIGVSEKEKARHIARAGELSLSLLYWLQTEAPRPDGKQGWPGLRLRKDLLGTGSGLAKYPYVRESRRIRAEFTVLEQHIGTKARSLITGQPETDVTAEHFPDSIGVGSYPIDLHPTTAGDNYIDFPTRPFQIPLGSVLPVRMENLLPACKNIGTTHVTNGCYRLHPVEWNIGESAGLLAAFALRKKVTPRQVRSKADLLKEFQGWITSQGVELEWKRS